MLRFFLTIVILFFGIGLFSQDGNLDTTFVTNARFGTFLVVDDSTYTGYATVPADQIPPEGSFAKARLATDIKVGHFAIDQIGRTYRISQINSASNAYITFECVELEETFSGPVGNGVIVSNKHQGIYPVVPQNTKGITPELFARIFNNNLSRQGEINNLILNSLTECDQQLITTFLTDSSLIVVDTLIDIEDSNPKLLGIFVNGQKREDYILSDSLVIFTSYTLMAGDTVSVNFCTGAGLGGGFEDFNGIYGGSGFVPDSTVATLLGDFAFRDSSGVDLIALDSVVSVYGDNYYFNSTAPPYDSSIQIWNTLGVPDWVDATSLGGGGGVGTNLTFTGSGPVVLNSDTGTDVSFVAGTSIGLVRAGNSLIINNTAGAGTNIYTSNGSLTGTRTANMAGNDLYWLTGGASFYITDAAFSNYSTWSDGGYAMSYNDGANVFSTITGGIGGGDAYFQHSATDGNRVSDIENTIDPDGGLSGDRAGFFVSVQLDIGADTSDVNFFIGEHNDETIDYTGLILTNSGTGGNKLQNAYIHMWYETTDSTFRLFDNTLIFDNEAVPSTTSSERSLMEWVGDGTDALPNPVKWNYNNVSTTTNASGEVTVAHGLGTTPTVAIVTIESGAQEVVVARGATNLTITFSDSGGTPVNAGSVDFGWLAFE